MDKREFIMSIARDLTVELIKGNQSLFSIPSATKQGIIKEQVGTIKSLYSAMVDGVASIYEDSKIT